MGVTDLSTVYNQTAAITGVYTVGTPSTGDIAVALVYNLGNLAAGDSNSISYAYTYLNSNSGVDSAFPDPQIVTSGVAHDATDTVNGCSVVGNLLTVNITNGTDKVWTNSNWSWAPSTGLSGTTGVSNTVNLLTITTPTVYTITGTMPNSCATKTFLLTVTPQPHSITAPTTSVCVGSLLTLTDATTGGTWSSSTVTVATVTPLSGVVTGVAAGTTTITYMMPGGCYKDTTITVLAAGSVAPITGATAVCAGATITLGDTSPGGAWTSSNTTATVSAGGVVTGVSGGVDTISYTLGSCGSSIATHIVTINSLPVVAAITGASSLCVGANTTLADATLGGTWSSSGATATVSGSGVVTAVSAGIDTIKYSLTNSCGTTIATKIITINTGATAGTISGPTSVCPGSLITLTETAGSGVWSASNGHATVSGGAVTGVSAGVDTILYTVSGGCGSATATYTITVNGLPNAGAISGPTGICGAGTITLSESVPGGTWSSGNSHATISGTGVVTGVTTGTDTISYAVGGGCGTAYATYIINIVTTPGVQTVTGPAVICAGSFALYSDSTAGGVWSVTNGNGSVTGTGVVTGLSTGLDTVVYTVTNACGTATATKAITISTLPTISPITGATTVCAGATTPLADATLGGTWGRTNTRANVSGTGVVTGLSTGIDTIIYSVTNACGTVKDSFDITIISTPVIGAITGPATVCAGSAAAYTDTTAGGAWSVTNGHATMAGGVLTGVSLGTDTIVYTVTNTCGTSSVTKPVSINPYPVAGVISGSASVCVGANISLSETMPSGIWSSSNTSLATVSATGVVTGVAAGTDTISYTISGGCAVVGTWAVINIAPLPTTGSITGPTAVCIGSSIGLAETIPGGTWSIANSHATVTGLGVVTGVTRGTDVVSYGVTNMCGTAYATSLITIDSFPVAGSISWTPGVCVGSAVTLIDTVPGGTWLASNGSAMVLGPGIIFGVSPGVDTIFYSVTNSCGTAQATKVLTVNALPVVAAITGPSEICVGTLASYTDGTPGGNWVSGTTSTATIDLVTGAAIGVAPGTTTITYTVTNALGCPASSTLAVTVDAVPVLPAITGTAHQCAGGTSVLADATAGGTWASGNTSVATVDATGTVTGVAAGTTTITYSVTNVCGATWATVTDTVYALPVVAAITPSATVCIGATTTLADATAGGTWASTNTTIATIGASTGVLTGIAAGNSFINYTITDSRGCQGTATTTATVNPLPAVNATTGVTDECLGSTTLLSNSTIGGTWASGNSAVATVSATGLVTSVSGGVAPISYTVTDAMGCSNSAVVNDTVNTVPVPTMVTGTMHLCEGATTTLADSSMFGVWSSTNTGVATINAASGVVTGVAAGTDIIIYQVTNPCGSATDTAIITVYALPTVAAISGPSVTVCAGASTILTDATTGGVWSSSDLTIATVGAATGIVTGVAAGSATITYTVTNGSGCAASTTYNVGFGSYLGTSSVLPGSATLCAGHSAYMHVVTSAGGLSYQWYRNGTAIPGANSYSYTTDSTGSYSVVISNGVCEQTLAGPVVSDMSVPVINFNAPNMLYTGSYAYYQWYRNGVAIPGATSSIYFETMPGGYTVSVTDANGCSLTSGGYTVTNVGVATVANPGSISIYPNPATNTLYISSQEEPSSVIYATDGRQVAAQTGRTLDIANLPNGMYVIMVYAQDGTLLKIDRLVKRD